MVGGGGIFHLSEKGGSYVWSVAGFLGSKDKKRERELFGKEKMESKIWEQWLPGITIGASEAKQPVDNSIKIKIKYRSAKYCSTIYA